MGATATAVSTVQATENTSAEPIDRCILRFDDFMSSCKERQIVPVSEVMDFLLDCRLDLMALKERSV